MRQKKTLKVSIHEIKKYCPFVKNIQLFYNANESKSKDKHNKNNVVLSVMSNLCPVGKAINEKRLIIIDNKSKINIFKILRKSNIISRHLVDSLAARSRTLEVKGQQEHNQRGEAPTVGRTPPDEYSLTGDVCRTQNTHSGECLCKSWGKKTSLHSNTLSVVENKSNVSLTWSNEAYNLFQKECTNDLNILLNKLHLDKRYRVFTILNKCRESYPNVYVENGKLLLPFFFAFFQNFGYKHCVGNSACRIGGNYDGVADGLRDSTRRKENTNSWDGCNVRTSLMKRTNEKTVVWCSNDYLCLSNNEQVIDVGIETLKKIGNSSGGTRNISGSLLNHSHLEYILAKWFNKESALLFTSGYIANVGALETLGKLLNLVFVSDEMNHASIINGIRESRCEKIIFKHNDMVDLERVLKKIRTDKESKNRKIMIVFESIYSMSGNISNIPCIVQLAKKYNALTYVDEVHAVGLYGKTGSGYLEELNLCDHIDIINGTLSKAIGSLGGFICANKYFIDVIRSYSPHFIFTTSLTPVNINTSAEAIHIIQTDRNLRNKFRKVVQKTKERLEQQGIHILKNNSHIVVALINSAEKCKQICDDLLTEYNIYLQPINYPTVPRGSERIRITPSPYHTDEHIEKLAYSLYMLFKKYQVNMFDGENSQAQMEL
ncbi:delta-aminolevulinic acid synthetase, putative [Plasmodium knowlesi strain H]|uniref:5-aminolevulinate synthase n=3 Tax=Plasmodium knowlesi TaxID=5850 RepID=A0A5K1TX53_PLAKH|nr:delta-aminolevulinic acid synthetase, putative [Plasmodium knowlesi strain H]OTN63776.1 putative Delta-aminolevulinic acid synthetase [Plasmodium knowlesi]CAA9991254.1 delta-aminolevulinic acid synthetase, putative [Plasmodium knowlesi strain H]SBO26334.1 delta-aminolevulinic acid synthetase, putative [Plasmodium knowlesi strain H]SBO29039.1 delta-aminolevulinic acid synthetase, putative [Plasmodium knowlesi strain H]VVS80728.1 delta-aminolevulinic acid synthetase, putative [Plasmodium know|eukprot:XP_002262533.1 delta-aminolevulinic acid synthethase, putative [Plasmodium knowlesi strain H]